MEGHHHHDQQQQQASGKSGGNGLSWDIWELGGSWGGFGQQAPQPPISTTTTSAGAAFQSDHHHVPAAHTISSSSSSSSFYPYHHHNPTNHHGGEAHHLTCLKLGKRQYYDEAHAAAAVGASSGGTKRERVVTAASMAAAATPLSAQSAVAAAVGSSSASAVAMAVVPRCQVEGCNVMLVDAKDYHRRHKVCDMHSKAPRVVVLGLEQRFCQQCSRFHVISEFDDSKRSCRRRLAGHNERRRKNSTDSILRNPHSSSLDHTTLGGRFPCISSPSTTPGRALSLLSSKASSWVSSDLSSRSSAALRELIAENRAAHLARQIFSDHRTWPSPGPPSAQAVLSYMPQQHPMALEMPSQLPDAWDHFHGAGAHVTLDLMQMPSSSFEILSGRGKSKEEEEECCEIWKSLEGTHVV